jgi:F0F1-type ATP synthase assembly protein I
MWAARILLVGILAIASISIVGTAIAMASPYIAALLVLWTIGWVIYKIIPTGSSK